jgi:hypothetical protein
MRDSSISLLVEWVTYGLMAYAGGKVGLGQFDPILAPTPIRPWISCVGESECLFEDDFCVAHRESNAVLEPCYFLPL